MATIILGSTPEFQVFTLRSNTLGSNNWVLHTLVTEKLILSNAGKPHIIEVLGPHNWVRKFLSRLVGMVCHHFLSNLIVIDITILTIGLGTPSERKTGLCGKNSQAADPPPPPQFGNFHIFLPFL